MPFGGQQQAVDRRATTSLLVREGAVQRQNMVDGVLVHCLCRFVRQKVGQIRADDDQGLRPTPQRLQHLGHLIGRGIPHGQWQELEIIQHHLQKGQLHLQRVFHGMGRRAHHHLAQVFDGVHSHLIHLNRAQGRGKGRGPRQGQA